MNGATLAGTLLRVSPKLRRKAGVCGSLRDPVAGDFRIVPILRRGSIFCAIHLIDCFPGKAVL
jgi:hypothetical protein